MKMITISHPDIRDAEIDAVVKTLKSKKIVQGTITRDFEKLFAKLCGVNYAVAVNSGTAALHVALHVAGLKGGDEVITTPFTFGATANAILMVGAKPIFVDIDPHTFNIDSAKITAAISKKTKAILPVNLYGQPADYEEVKKIANEHQLLVIEDAAQSIGASYQGKMSGNLSDIGCFSLYATKNVMSIEGGMLTTNDPDYYQKAKAFRNHGQRDGVKYDYDALGYNYRLNDVSSSIGIEQLKRIDEYTQKRRANADSYDKLLTGVNGLVLPFRKMDRSHVFHQYTIRVTDKFKLSRDKLRDYLTSKKIETAVYYPEGLFSFTHFLNGHIDKQFYLHTQMATEQVLSLPVHPAVTMDEIKYISSCIINI